MTRTSNYRFTTNDRFGPEVKALREEVNARNRELRQLRGRTTPVEKIYIRGRLGPNNPLAQQVYRSHNRGNVPLSLATRFDVYVMIDYTPRWRYGSGIPAPLPPVRPTNEASIEAAARNAVESALESTKAFAARLNLPESRAMEAFWAAIESHLPEEVLQED